MDAIRTIGRVKRCGRTRALDELDLTVGEGQVHGLLGPNGAGKSTAIRILLGLARATGGIAEMLGASTRDPRPPQAGAAAGRGLPVRPAEAGSRPLQGQPAGDRPGARGRATVLLSSHVLSEVEQLCERVSIITAGRVVETGTPADLRHRTRIEVSFALPAGLMSAFLAVRHTRMHEELGRAELVTATPRARRAPGSAAGPPAVVGRSPGGRLRLIPLGWILLVVGAVLGLFGPLFGLSEALTNASPFAAAPTVGDGEIRLDGPCGCSARSSWRPRRPSS